jgi:uncharacterized protein YdaU (DUF1376 family)
MNAPFFKFYQKDFIASTVAMSAEEVGAFIRLLCYQWEHGEIPDDVEKLARIGGCSGNAVESVLNKFCIRSVSGLKNARMEEVRASMIEIGEKKRANIAKRWAGVSKNSQNSPAEYKPDTNPIQAGYKQDTDVSGLNIQNAYLSEDRRQKNKESLSHRVREAGNGVEPERIQPATVSEEEPAARGIGSREIPDWPSVKAHADAIGLPEWKAQLWFNTMEGVGWLANGQPVRKWRPLLTSVRTYWEADGRPSQPASRNGSTRQTQREKEAALHGQKSEFGF